MLKIKIDQSALKNNLARIRTFAPGKKILAMVKANGYGHGLVRVAKILKEADAFGVASIEEGILLRKVGIKQPIVLMRGFLEAKELVDISHYDITPVIHHQAQIKVLSDTIKNKPLKKPFSVWLKINTGMHRLGLPSEQVPMILKELLSLSNIQVAGLMTHFGSADVRENAHTQAQIDLFNQTIKTLPPLPVSLANSAAILAWPQSHGDWVRPGITLYGVSPFVDQVGAEYGLQPVMQLESRIIAIHRVKKGERIGYEGAFVCPEDMPVGVVSIGYGDGYPRQAPSGIPVLVNGIKTFSLGHVSMDMMSVDLRLAPNTKIGDPVVLWGRGLPVEEVARAIGTIPFVLLTHMLARAPEVVEI